MQDCQQEDDSICNVVLKKTPCDVELDIKCSVVVHDCQQGDDSICKVVEKKTSFGVELENSVKI